MKISQNVSWGRGTGILLSLTLCHTVKYASFVCSVIVGISGVQINVAEFSQVLPRTG